MRCSFRESSSDGTACADAAVRRPACRRNADETGLRGADFSVRSVREAKGGLMKYVVASLAVACLLYAPPAQAQCASPAKSARGECARVTYGQCNPKTGDWIVPTRLRASSPCATVDLKIKNKKK